MSDPSQAADPSEADPLLCCDFCGEPADSVRRVALDGEYDRLRTRHKKQYACPSCSERKEKERLGIPQR